MEALVNLKIFIVLFAASLICESSIGQSTLSKTLSYQDSLPTGVDLNEVKSPNSLSKLAKIKWYQINGDWQKCVETSASEKNKLVQVWVAYVHLTCLKTWYSTAKSGDPKNYIQFFKKLGDQKNSLMNSPLSIHKEKLVRVFLDLLQISAEKSRSQFNSLVEEQQDLVDIMDKDQRAEYYKVLGEMAWLTQEDDLAKAHYLRSYSFKPDPVVQSRLESLKAHTLLKIGKYSKNTNPSEDEVKLFEQFTQAKNKGLTTPMVERGVEFLNRYPGSIEVESIKSSISTVYKKLLFKRGEKFDAAKANFERELKKAPPQHIVGWASDAYQRGYQESCYNLAEAAAEKWKGDPQAAEALILAGRSAYYSAQVSSAENSCTESSFEANYLLGLLYFRQGEFEKVIKIYDQFLTSSGSDKWELQIRYWLYRSFQKIKSTRSKDLAETILKNFPLTYYGLIVRMEEQKNLKSLFNPEIKTIKSSFYWTKNTEERWQRIKVLLEAGWLQEAESEIDYLPDPALPEQLMIRAKLWSSASLYHRSFQDYAAAVDRNPLFITKTYAKTYFPDQYQTGVEAAEKEFKISKNLIWAIIRQESAFMPRAVSPSNALGLMQMLGPTAKETAKWLKVKNLKVPEDVFKTTQNIRFGSHFLSRMVRKYQGVIPLAVASYNVGPGNLDRWLSFRKDLSNWSSFGQNPEDDLWIDELPWAETSFYVKAVMRNFLLYQLMYENQDVLPHPPWKNAQTN